MKNNRHQILCVDAEKDKECVHFNGEVSNSRRPIKRRFPNLGWYTILAIGFYLLFPWKVLSQEGDVINEGIFQIKSATIVSSNSSFTNETSGALKNDGELILRANLLNYGETGFNPNLDGLTSFKGNSEQELSGDKAIDLNNILFENNGEGIRFLLKNDLNVYGTADFTKGIVDNTHYFGNFTFYESATNKNTSNNSFVNGPVRKLGNSDFTFPIGKESFYRLAKIGSIPNNSQYETTYFLENSDAIYPHDQKDAEIEEIDDTEYWTLNRETPDTEDVLLTLSWNEQTTQESIYVGADQGEIAIVRWDESSKKWINEGGVADLNAKTVTTSISKDGFFTLARTNESLDSPCQVVAYSAVTPNGDGRNDFFRIDLPGGDCANNLKVSVFNRWGVKVFETDNYGSNGDYFDGISSGRLTLNRSSQLPSGTYYYILDYQYGSDPTARHKKAGFLYLSGN